MWQVKTLITEYSLFKLEKLNTFYILTNFIKIVLAVPESCFVIISNNKYWTIEKSTVTDTTADKPRKLFRYLKVDFEMGGKPMDYPLSPASG